LKEIFTKIHGQKIRYIASSSSDDQFAILFIHGLGSSADRWMDLPEALSSYFWTCALDLMGFGKSDKPQNFGYDIAAFVELIREFMHVVGIDKKKIILVGHSLGGYIACEFVIKYPFLMHRLILVDSSGTLQSPTPLLKEYLDLAMNPTPDKAMSVFRKMAVNPIFASPFIAEIFIRYISNAEAKNAFKLTLENSANTQIGLERLQKIRVPTLIIWGSEDKVIPIQHALIFHRQILGSQLQKITNTGHAPYVEKPSVVFDLIKKFLTRDYMTG